MISYEENENKEIISLSVNSSKMNWCEGEFHRWGECVYPNGITLSVKRNINAEGKLHEEYSFFNATENTVAFKEGELGIWAPFNDSLEASDICLSSRCHTHIWCGGESSWVCALSMGVTGDNLGLFLTSGSLCSYSVERRNTSNDRGDFLLLSSPTEILPNTSYIIAWDIFTHNVDDFYDILSKYPNYLDISSPYFTFFENEEPKININGKAMLLDNRLGYHTKAVDNSFFRYQVKPIFKQTVKNRIDFIVSKQQEASGRLSGAYLIFDNEEQKRVCLEDPNRNSGRERIGMGILIAKYLQRNFDFEIYKSLEKYADFVLREHFDVESGEVFNELGKNNSRRRIYNNAWYALFFKECYKIKKEKRFLNYMCGAFNDLYAHGGTHFYPLAIDMVDSINCLRDAHIDDAPLFNSFTANAEFIYANGTNYPKLEVNYEDNIVVPAGSVMLQMYELTGNTKYLTAAREHLTLHSAFCFTQPDARMHCVAIHHWDDFWFGKRKLYGDTYPHYWSTVGSMFTADISKYCEDEKMLSFARAGIRSALSCFFDDGSAACAIVTPFSINGEEGAFIDPYANDQDWALYYALLFDEKYGL